MVLIKPIVIRTRTRTIWAFWWWSCSSYRTLQNIFVRNWARKLGFNWNGSSTVVFAAGICSSALLDKSTITPPPQPYICMSDCNNPGALYHIRSKSSCILRVLYGLVASYSSCLAFTNAPFIAAFAWRFFLSVTRFLLMPPHLFSTATCLPSEVSFWASSETLLHRGAKETLIRPWSEYHQLWLILSHQTYLRNPRYIFSVGRLSFVS